jgi:hypothetical protein
VNSGCVLSLMCACVGASPVPSDLSVKDAAPRDASAAIDDASVADADIIPELNCKPSLGTKGTLLSAVIPGWGPARRRSPDCIISAGGLACDLTTAGAGVEDTYSVYENRSEALAGTAGTAGWVFLADFEASFPERGELVIGQFEGIGVERAQVRLSSSADGLAMRLTGYPNSATTTAYLPVSARPRHRLRLDFSASTANLRGSLDGTGVGTIKLKTTTGLASITQVGLFANVLEGTALPAQASIRFLRIFAQRCP